jgi:hypothetical protein
MTCSSPERAAELAAIIARRSSLSPYQIASHVLHLQRIARQAVTIATNLCNVPGYQPVFDRRMAALRKHAATLCDVLGTGFQSGLPLFNVKLGGDPRGPCCRLWIDGEPGDGYDRADDGTGSFAVY